MRCSTRLVSSTRALLLLVVCVVLASCNGSDLRTTSHEKAASSRPNLSVDLVEHAPAKIEPRIDWHTSTVARSPMSLTAGDGSGLRLVSLTGTVVIEDPLAFTELHLTFENPEPRRREGRFEFELPGGAALSRLAMQIGRRWMEGEVVERSAGRETFEEYLHFRPKVDPALLETAGANRVSARVFPILPRERKEIIVSYSQPLIGGAGDGDEPRNLRLPLSGLPELEVLDLRVLVKTCPRSSLPPLARDPRGMTQSSSLDQRVLELRERDFAPSGDLVVNLDGAQDAGALRAEELVAVRVRPELPDQDEDEAIESLTVLFDTSASAAPVFDVEVDRLGAMLETLGDTPVRLLAFDQGVELIHDGPASAALGAPLVALRERRAFGASDLYAALSHPQLRPAPHQAQSARLLIWSDGVATAGELQASALADAAAGLGFARVDAYASTTSADRERLTALVGSGLRAGFVIGPELPGQIMLDTLGAASFGAIEISVNGADWSYPHTLEGFAPGDDIVVYASFPEAAPERVQVSFSDERLATHLVPTVEGETPLVLRAVARARVDELQDQLDATRDPDEAEQLRLKLVESAIDNRLLTRHTALLVLENGDEYRRYGIARSARTDILTVGPTGVELLRRGAGPSHATTSGLFAMRGPKDGPSEGMPSEAKMGSLRNSNDEAGGRGQRGHFLATPYGGAVSVGNEDSDIWGGLTGTEIGEAYGVGGLGLVGTGRGGGGSGEGTIGLGNLGLIGKGSGGGTGAGYGRGSGAGFGGRGKRIPTIRQAKAQVSGALDRDIIRRVVRAHINEVRSAYNAGLMRDPRLSGRVEIQFVIDGTGKVASAQVSSSSLPDSHVANSIAKAVRRWRFPKPRGGGSVIVRYPFILDVEGSGSGRGWQPRAQRPQRRPGDPSDPDGARWKGSAQSGRYGEITTLASSGQLDAARAEALDWATTEPDNVLALLALVEQLERAGELELAGRVAGSLIDLHPERADMRRTAGARLEALGPELRALAIDSYEKAVEQRPDQINGHRLLAWALVKDGQHERAYEVLERALATSVPAGRFRGVKSLLRQDRELVAAAWLATTDDLAVLERLERDGVHAADEPSMRLVAHWETDATDVDILVDGLGSRAGRRHADVRTGFGPEAWIATGSRQPKTVDARVRYFNRGAMGYALGTVSAIVHDGAGHLSFRERPFVLMNASGSVDLGRFG